MKILHVIESLSRAGAEQMLVNILPELNKRGLHNEVAVLFPPYDLQEDLESRGIVVHRLNLIRERRWNIAYGAEKLRRLARRGDYDFLHSHLLFANIYNAATRPLLKQPRRVTTLHGTDFDDFTDSRAGRAMSRVLPVILRRGFDGSTAVSNPAVEHFCRFVPGLDVRHIPNALPLEICPDLQLDPVQTRTSFGLPTETPLLVTVGRLVPMKGHEWLFKALVELAKRDLYPHLLLLGEGAHREQLEILAAQLNIAERVTFAGAMPQHEMMPLVQSSDIFVLPSLQEGFGLAPAEAMLMEKPAITTNAGGLTDLIEHEHSGLLVPPANATALADAIERLLKDQALRERLGREGRQYIVERFGAPMIAARWENFYREIGEKSTN